MVLRRAVSAQLSRQIPHKIKPQFLHHEFFSQWTVLKQHVDAKTLHTKEQSNNGEYKRTGPEPKAGGWRRTRAWLVPIAGLPVGWYLSEWLRDNGAHQTVAPPTEFVKYTLVAKEPVSSTCSIFRLRPATSRVLDVHNPTLARSLLSVEFKQPHLQVARAYTLLPAENTQDVDELRFLVRRESRGEVSNFLHRLPLQSDIEVRGPAVEYELPGTVGSVVFIAGGTGIAPALQVADILEGSAALHVLWANRRREDCIGGVSDTHVVRSGWWSRIFSTRAGTSSTQTATSDVDRSEANRIVDQIASLKRLSQPEDQLHSRLKVDFYVDEEQSYIKSETVRAAVQSVPKAADPATPTRNVLFVSGPPGFVAHWAGPKLWANGRETQGPLAGVLSTLDLKGWDVVKL